jgi:hypothetical protein
MIIFSKLSRSLVPSCFALVVASSVESALSDCDPSARRHPTNDNVGGGRAASYDDDLSELPIPNIDPD